MNFSYKFLVAAGSPEQAEKLTQTLKNDFEGCAIHATCEGQEAVDFCRANVYDLIIAEFRMEDMNADEMAGKIRQLQNDNLSCGILVVERADDEGLHDFKNIGHVMFVEAPFERANYHHCAKVLLALKQ